MTSRLQRLATRALRRHTSGTSAPLPPVCASYIQHVAIPAVSTPSIEPTYRSYTYTRMFHAPAAAAADVAGENPSPAATSIPQPSTATQDLSASPPPQPAPVFLRMPTIDGVGKCRLLRWIVPVGQPYEQGTVLCEIDSDLAVIEYKAQSPGILALVRTQAGERIVEDQVLALQVERMEDIANAEKWSAHVKALESKEKAELEAHEAREEVAAQEILRKEQLEQDEACGAAKPAS